MKSYIGKCLLIVFLLLTGCGRAVPPEIPLDTRIANAQEMILSLRRGLTGHSQAITVRFEYGSDIFDELNGVIEEWMEAALSETDEPDEGDYLRYQIGGYSYTSRYEIRDGRYLYEVKVVPEYFSYLSQEQAVDEETARRLLACRFLPWTGEEEKIRRIYGDICSTVTYDKVHQKNPYDHRGSTAYAALVQGTATCQGYCTALYRLLRESGISCRIVTGTAGEETLHAWVIARVGEVWYLLDPTWDAGKEEYDYCLAGTAESLDHVPGKAFTSEEFTTLYPLAEHGLS